MTTVSLAARTQPAVLDEAPKYYPFNEWTAQLAEATRLSRQDEGEPVRHPGYTSFVVSTLALSLASDRWVVKWPGHPEVTFEDLRNGRIPKPTPEELDRRKQAVKEAQEIRSYLNIAPLTTSTLIRQLRDGSDRD